MTSPDLPALPPEIAALLDKLIVAAKKTEFAVTAGYATEELRREEEAAAHRVLVAALAPLVRDAALGKALREAVETGDSAGGRLYIEWGGDQPPGVARENWATLRDDNDSCYALARLLAAARTGGTPT